MRLRRRARRQRPIRVPRPRRGPPPEQQLCAADLPPRLRWTAPDSQPEARQASRRGRHGMAGHPGRVVAASRAREAVRSPVRPGHPPPDRHGEHRPLSIVWVRGQAVPRREDRRSQDRGRPLPGQRGAARRRRTTGVLAAGQGRADAPRPQDVDGRGRHSGNPGRAEAGTSPRPPAARPCTSSGTPRSPMTPRRAPARRC
jgi:hypothetical protein